MTAPALTAVGRPELARFCELVHDLAPQAIGRGNWTAAIGYLTQARDLLPPAHAARPGLDRQITALHQRAAEHAYAVQQARTAWLTASRDDELDRWNDLYELEVPRPRPAAAAAERRVA